MSTALAGTLQATKAEKAESMIAAGAGMASVFYAIGLRRNQQWGRWMQWLLILAFLFCVFPLFGKTALASSIVTTATQVSLTEQYTRITLEFNNPVQYELSMLSHPDRVFIDLMNIPLNDAIKSLPDKVNPADPLIERIRYGRFKPHIIRIVLDLKAKAVPRVSFIDPQNGHGYRLMLDIYHPTKAASVEHDRGTITKQKHHHAHNHSHGHDADELDHLIKSLIKHKPQHPQVNQPLPYHKPASHLHHTALNDTAIDYPKSFQAALYRKPVQSSKPTRIITIAIDPGHGGHDPGAIAKNGKGTKEKDITLAISRKLKAIINKEPNMRAILTRNGDYFLNLNQRQAIARQHNADLFVSIHADGSEKIHPSGSSVYTLSEHGATSTTASWLAKQENTSGGNLIGGVDIAGKSGDMREVILDLSMNAMINDSVKVAEFVLEEIGRINRLHKKTVEQAGFVVLKSPDIPSILVETAFITNPHEEKKLINNKYQDKMANAIYTGIRNYFATNPALARTEMARVR